MCHEQKSQFDQFENFGRILVSSLVSVGHTTLLTSSPPIKTYSPRKGLQNNDDGKYVCDWINFNDDGDDDDHWIGVLTLRMAIQINHPSSVSNYGFDNNNDATSIDHWSKSRDISAGNLRRHLKTRSGEKLNDCN